jgi:hypothetical protein
MHVLRSSGQPEYSGVVKEDPRHVVARKLAQHVEVRFADAACTVQTTEGVVHARPGDWLVDYGDGSLGIVAPATFSVTYEILD